MDLKIEKKTKIQDAYNTAVKRLEKTEVVEEKRRREIYRKKTEETEDETIEKWQEVWNISENGRWTYRLIKNIRPWIRSKHGNLNYVITQALSDHGCFNTYRKRITKTENNECWFGCNVVDDPEHTLFYCMKWSVDREELKNKIDSEWSPETMIKKMLESKEKWKEIEDYTVKILKEKIEYENILDKQKRQDSKKKK